MPDKILEKSQDKSLRFPLNQTSLLDSLPGLIAVLLWSAGAYLIYQMRHIPTFQILALGQFFGGILSLYFEKHTLSFKHLANRIKKGWPILSVFWVSQYGYIYAFQNAPPAQVELIFYSWPTLLIIVQSRASLKRLRIKDWIGMTFGFLSIAVLLYPDLKENTMSSQYLFGYIAGALGAIGWVWYLLSIEKPDSKKSGFSAIGEDIVILGVVNLILLASFKQWIEPSLSDWIFLIIYAIGMFGIPYRLWKITLAKHPKMAGALSNATPVISIVWLVIAGITPFTGELIAALLMITISLYLLDRQRSKAC